MKNRTAILTAIALMCVAGQSFAFGSFLVVDPTVIPIGHDVYRLRFDVQWSGPLLYYDYNSGTNLVTDPSNGMATDANLGYLDCAKLGSSQFNPIPSLGNGGGSPPGPSSGPGSWFSGFGNHSQYTGFLNQFSTFGYDFLYDGPRVKTFALSYDALLFWPTSVYNPVAERFSGEVDARVVSEVTTLPMFLVGLLGGIGLVWRKSAT